MAKIIINKDIDTLQVSIKNTSGSGWRKSYVYLAKLNNESKYFYVKSVSYNTGTLPTGVAGITCTRISSQYAEAPINITINNGDKLYYGDVIKITARASTGYQNPTIINGGSDLTISGPLAEQSEITGNYYVQAGDVKEFKLNFTLSVPVDVLRMSSDGTFKPLKLAWATPYSPGYIDGGETDGLPGSMTYIGTASTDDSINLNQIISIIRTDSPLKHATCNVTEHPTLSGAGILTGKYTVYYGDTYTIKLDLNQTYSISNTSLKAVIGRDYGYLMDHFALSPPSTINGVSPDLRYQKRASLDSSSDYSSAKCWIATGTTTKAGSTGLIQAAYYTGITTKSADYITITLKQKSWQSFDLADCLMNICGSTVVSGKDAYYSIVDNNPIIYNSVSPTAAILPIGFVPTSKSKYGSYLSSWGAQVRSGQAKSDKIYKAMAVFPSTMLQIQEAISWNGGESVDYANYNTQINDKLGAWTHQWLGRNNFNNNVYYGHDGRAGLDNTSPGNYICGYFDNLVIGAYDENGNVNYYLARRFKMPEQNTQGIGQYTYDTYVKYEIGGCKIWTTDDWIDQIDDIIP